MFFYYSTTGEVITLPEDAIVGSEFNTLNKLNEFNVSLIEEGKRYTITDKGNMSDADWTNLGADSDPAVGETFTASDDGPTGEDGKVGRGISIAAKSQEKFKLLFNKNNFGENKSLVKIIGENK